MKSPPSMDAASRFIEANAVPAIIVEGPGRRGELVQVCANAECEVHGKSNHRANQDAVKEREQEWKREQETRERNREENRRLLDAVLECVPKKLGRADYEMLVTAAISRLDYEDLEAACGRYKIETEDISEPDAVHFELQQKAIKATEAQLIRMLVEFAPVTPMSHSKRPTRWRVRLHATESLQQPRWRENAKERNVLRNQRAKIRNRDREPRPKLARVTSQVKEGRRKPPLYFSRKTTISPLA
ncbi:MAG: hypothetical protein JO033_20195 [Acidobacteriaceae bacterium]|nr:hypothetical protein [Acidobacteriaceae bacterium]